MQKIPDITLLLVPIDHDLYERLVSVAKAEGVSVNDLGMMAIANYLGDK